MRWVVFVFFLAALMIGACTPNEHYWPGCPTYEEVGGNGGAGGVTGGGGQGGGSGGNGGVAPRPTCNYPAEVPPED